MITKRFPRICSFRIALMFLLIAGLPSTVHSQSSWVFEDFYGRQGVSDFGMCVKSTEDGGAITIGSSESFGAGDPVIHIIRVDPLGNPVWEKYYDKQAYVRDMSIAQCENGDFVWTAGVILFGQTSYDILVVRMGPDGSVLWARLLGFGNSRDEYAHAIVETRNGDVAVSGVTINDPNRGDDLVVARFKSDGTWLWAYHYGSAGDDDNHGLLENIDENLYAAGAIAASAGGLDAWLLEIDAAGSPGWSHSYGLNDGLFDWFLNVVENPDNGELYAVGHDQRGSGLGNSVIVAVDASSGAVSNAIRYRHNLAGAGHESARSIVYAPEDKEFVVCGRYQTATSVTQPYTAAFPSDLSAPLWMRRRQQIEAGAYRSIDITNGNREYDQGGGYWIAGSLSEDQTWHSTRRFHSLTRTNWNGKTDCTQDLEWDSDNTVADIGRDISFFDFDEAVEVSVKGFDVKTRNEECPGIWIGSNAKFGAKPQSSLTSADGFAARLQQSILLHGEKLRVEFLSGSASSARIVISDIQGRVHYDAADVIRGGQFAVEISTDAWMPGTYYVQIRFNNRVQALRFVLSD